MDEYEHAYIGTKEEEMDAEGREVDDQDKPDVKQQLCANCLDYHWTKNINGTHLCRMCAERWPQGMPF